MNSLENEKFNKFLALGITKEIALELISQLQERDRRIERARKLEAVAERATKVGYGAWEMLTSEMLDSPYNLCKQ